MRSRTHRVLGIVAFAVLVVSAAVVAGVAATEDASVATSRPGQDAPTSAGDDGVVTWSSGAVPTADCEASPRHVEPGEAVTLDASGTEDAEYVEFDGDGDGVYERKDSEEFVVTVDYRTVGTYQPQVRAVGDGNETATCGEVVVGNPPPTANISYEPSNPVTGQPITFDGTNSTDPDGEIASYEWYVDGEFANNASAFDYRTDESGTYRVTLVVTDDDGATDEATTNVTVEANEPPAAAVSASPGPATVGQAITLDASNATDPDGEVVEYRWDLDGDGVYDRTTEKPTVEYTYEKPETYTVVVEVRDDDGATDAAETRIEVQPREGPVARCTVEPAEVEPGERVVVDARETTDATAVRVDDDGDGTFDRTLEDEYVVELRYEEPGTYEPRVQAVDEFGGATPTTDTATCGEVVVATNEPPTAVLQVSPSPPASGEAVVLDASNATDSDGEIVEYRWDLDGDGVYDRTTEKPTVEYTYEKPGTYTVVVEVRDDDGATDVAERRIDVVPSNEPPTASFAHHPSTPAPGGTVTFDASNATDSDGEIVEYRWDLDGDGVYDRTTEKPTVEYTYDRVGNVTVVLQVVDDDGATDESERELRVAEPSPGVPLEDVLPPLLLGGVTAAAVAWWRARRGPEPGGGKSRRKHYPKPKPSLLSKDVRYYAAGTFEVPAAGTSTVSVADVGFEPDLLLLTATNADRIDAFPRRSESRSTGVAMRTPDGIEQHVTVVADDALSTDQATISTADGDAIAAVRHGDGPPGDVRGRVVATTADGFEVVVAGVADATDAGRIGVQYRAFNLPYEAEVETGHFRTPVEPGLQTVELGVDADFVALTASSAVGDLDRQWTTDRSVGVSMGTAVGQDPIVQTVRNGTVWPGHDARAVDFGAADRALYLPYHDGDRIAGRTAASVVGVGERLALRYDRLYSGPEKIGWTDPHVVSYVAMNCGGVVRPAIGAVRLPAPGETVDVEIGVEPGMVEFATCGAGTLGIHDRAAAAPGPFVRSTGTAVTDDDGLAQYLLPGTGAATPPPGPTVAGAVDPATVPGNVAGEAAPDGGDEAATDGGDEVNATPDGRVATTLSLDDDGTISGRDDLQVDAFTDAGFRLSVEAVSTDDRDPDAETRPFVFYRAWPAIGADAAPEPASGVGHTDADVDEGGTGADQAGTDDHGPGDGDGV